MSETWKSIPGYEGCYSASSFGRVRSEDRFVKHRSGKRKVRSRILSQCKAGPDSRLYVSLWKENNGRMFYVHKVVLLAFRGFPVPGTESSHVDGDKYNNSISNLLWESHSDNLKRRDIHGTTSRGEARYNSRLTEPLAFKIRSSDHSDYYWANLLGVSRTTILDARSRKTWAWVS